MVRLASKATYMTKEEESRTGITSHTCKILLLSNLHISILGREADAESAAVEK